MRDDCWCERDSCRECNGKSCFCHEKTRGGEALDECGLSLRRGGINEAASTQSGKRDPLTCGDASGVKNAYFCGGRNRSTEVGRAVVTARGYPLPLRRLALVSELTDLG